MSKVNISGMAGVLLTQLCFGPYQTIVRFENDVSISIECVFLYCDNNKKIFNIDFISGSGFVNASELTKLIGQSVNEMFIENNDLKILFNSKSYIFCKKDLSSGNESFVISTPDETIVG